MSDEVKGKAVELHGRDIPTVFVDNLIVGTRADEIHFIRMTTHQPEGQVEQARIMVTDATLKRMISVLCAHLQYYPKKSAASKRATKKKKKPAVK